MGVLGNIKVSVYNSRGTLLNIAVSIYSNTVAVSMTMPYKRADKGGNKVCTPHSLIIQWLALNTESTAGGLSYSSSWLNCNSCFCMPIIFLSFPYPNVKLSNSVSTLQLLLSQRLYETILYLIHRKEHQLLWKWFIRKFYRRSSASSKNIFTIHGVPNWLCICQTWMRATKWCLMKRVL